MMDNQIQRESAVTENNINNNLSNAIIIAQQVHFGSGSNISSQIPTNNPATTEYTDDKTQQDCEKLKEYLRKKAENNCLIEQVNLIENSNLTVKYVPLQMVQVNQVEDIKEDIRNVKKESKEILTQQPNDELNPETFFILSKKFAEKSDKYKKFVANDVTKEMKEIHLNKLSNLVFVVGHAGIGKTCLTKRYLQLFLNNKISADYLFYIKFRDIDYERETNFMTFLTGDVRYENYDDQRLHNLLQEISNNDKVILVLDGFDEARLQVDKNNKAKPDLYKKVKAQDFILGLLNGKILCKSKKLVTSRPKQLFDLPKQYQPLFIVKLLGIDKNSQKQICENICGDDFESIFKKIQSNSGLSNYCSVPLISIIIVYCMYKNLEFEHKIPSSLTEIFIILICMYLKDPTHIRGELPFENLCELAFNGILNQKLFFNQDDLKKFSLDKQDQNNFTVTILCKDRTDKLNFYSNATLQYTYFSHLIVQEWFAALYLMLYAEIEEFNEVLFSKDCKINLRSTNFDVFVLFLFGLSNDSMFKEYCHHLPNEIKLNIYPKKFEMLKNYLCNMKIVENVLSKDYHVYSWFYELNDRDVTHLVADKLDYVFIIDANDLPENNFLPLIHVLRCRSKKIGLRVWNAREPLLLQEIETSLKQNDNIKLEYLGLKSLNKENISASIFLLQKVEGFRIGDFPSKQIGSTFREVFMQKQRLFESLKVDFGLDDDYFSALCSTLQNIGKVDDDSFSSKEVAYTFSQAVSQLEHPLKRLELYQGLNDKNISAICSCLPNVEELFIYEFSSEEVASSFSVAILQREHPLKRLDLGELNDLSDVVIFVICSCFQNIEELGVDDFSSEQAALKFSDAVLLQELPLKRLRLSKLSDENISAICLCLKNVEELKFDNFSSEQVASMLADAVLQLEQPLKRLELGVLNEVGDGVIFAICSCLENIEEFVVDDFSSKQVALKFSVAVMQLEHPIKKLECFCSNATIEQSLLICKENVEEFTINFKSIEKPSSKISSVLNSPVSYAASKNLYCLLL